MWRGLLFSFGLLAVFVSMILIDQSFAIWLFQEQHQQIRDGAREITEFALGEHWFLVALCVFLVSFAVLRSGKFSERARWVAAQTRLWSFHLFVSLLGSGILLQILKFAIGRQRPHRTPTFEALVFKPFTLEPYFNSLPSGHSQVMFCVAATLTLLKPRWAWAFYLIAAGFAFTRVLILQHFLSDVVAGAMVGYFGTLFVRDILKHNLPRPEPL